MRAPRLDGLLLPEFRSSHPAHGRRERTAAPDALLLNLRGRLAAVMRSGLPYLLLSMISVQGLTYASQALVAKVLSPEDFGCIRTVEAVLATLLVFGSLGMPTLAVRFAAETSDEWTRRRLLLRLLAIALTTCLLSAGVVRLVAPSLFPEPTASYLNILIGVVALTASSRILQGYALGTNRIRAMSIMTFLLSLVALPALVGATWWRGTSGWLVGRYGAETLLALGLLFSVWSTLSRRGGPDCGPTAARLMRLGLPIALSLLLRTGQDAVGLLSLNLLRAPATLIGHLGLGSLALAVLSVVPGAVANLALPRMTQRRQVPQQSRALLLRSVTWGFWLTAPASAVVLVATPFLLAKLLPAYTEAGPVLQIMVLIAPCRSVISMSGSCLLAHLNVGFGLWANGTALLGALALSLLVGARYGALGIALVALGVELATAAAFLLAARRATRESTAE